MIDTADERMVNASAEFSNRFVIQVGPQIVRISFGDQRMVGGDNMPVANLVLNRDSAVQLRDLLDSLLPK